MHRLLIIFAALACLSFTATAKDALPAKTHDGLVLQEGTEVAAVYKLPGADLGDYNKIALLEAYVAFKKNWQRENNADHTGLDGRISDKEMKEIRERLAEEFQKVFTEVLSKEGGHEMVSEGAEGVLIIRPAIINLDVAAPDTMTSGRDRNYSAYAGEMTLYMELFDGRTGQIIYRVIDARAAGNDFWRLRNQVTNRADADRVLRRWATLLNEQLAKAKQ